MGTAVARSFKLFGAALRKAGPYLVLEIVLPGGTLFALALFLHQRRGLLDAGIASLWRGRHPERDGLEALSMLPAPAITPLAR